MRKLFFVLMPSLVFLFVPFVAVQAVNIIPNDVCNRAPNSPACQGNRNNPEDPITGSDGIVLKVANIIAWFGGALAVIMIIYAGFKYVTSGGEQGRIKTAKFIIVYSIVGLVVIVLSRVIIAFVLSRL